MAEQDVEVRDEEDLAMEAAQAAIDAARNKDAEPAPEVVPPEVQAEEAPQEGVAPVADEPFEGFSQLSETAKAKWLEVEAKAKRAEELAAAEAKLRNDFNALHNRMAPLQRKLSDYEKQPRPQQATAKPSLDVNEWLKTQSPERQRYFREFPEEGRAAFEIARDLFEGQFSQQIRSIQEQTARQFQDLQFKSELSRLAATHNDYKEFGFREVDGKREPLTQKAADYLAWAAAQGQEVQAAIDSDSADDVSATLSLYKWETSDPIVREVMYSPDFSNWLSRQSRHIQAMARSLDIEDRKDALHLFAGHLEQQQPAQADPKTAARVQQVAQRREQQSRSVSPSFRPNVAPASAANTGGEDADWAAANARIEQWRKRQ